MAGNKKCDFCGAVLPPEAKYCEECWKLLASPSHSRLQRYGRRLITLRSNVFRGHTLTRTGKKRLVTGISVIFFTLLVIALVVTPHSNLYASNSIGERATVPSLSPPVEILPATPTVTISPSLDPPTTLSDVTVTPPSTVRCERLELCDIMLYSSVMATPHTTPTPPPSPTAVPIPTTGLATIEASPLLPDPSMILILYAKAPTPYPPTLSEGAL